MPPFEEAEEPALPPLPPVGSDPPIPSSAALPALPPASAVLELVLSPLQANVSNARTLLSKCLTIEEFTRWCRASPSARILVFPQGFSLQGRFPTRDHDANARTTPMLVRRHCSGSIRSLTHDLTGRKLAKIDSEEDH